MTGARRHNGDLCIGRGKDSRSKYSRTRFHFMNLETGETYERLAHKIGWMKDSRTQALLNNALRELLADKGVVPFDRGAAVARSVDCTLYLGEVVRGSVRPRYWWPLPYNVDPVEAVSRTITSETQHKEVLGREDRRPVVDGAPLLKRDLSRRSYQLAWSVEWWAEENA